MINLIVIFIENYSIISILDSSHPNIEEYDEVALLENDLKNIFSLQTLQQIKYSMHEVPVYIKVII